MRCHILLLASLLALGACSIRPGTAWPPESPAKGTAVLFAPVDMGPLAHIHPDGHRSWCQDLAVRLDMFCRSADGFAGLDLPGSADPAWNTGLPAAAKPAEVVVLTRVTAVEDTSSPSAGRRFTATVEIRALGADGREAWRRVVRGDAEGPDQAKPPGPTGRTECRAGWAAATNACSGLIEWLNVRATQASAPAAAPIPGPVLAAGEVEVVIDSVPPNADVLVDGKLRGTTPATLRLRTDTEVTVRLERAGNQPWERRLAPSAGLRLAPALAPAAP
jgi:hypothetical protein